MVSRVVIITGASSGIGEALSYKFAEEGYFVALAARRIERLKEIGEKIGNDKVIIIETDVSSEESCQNLISKTVEKFGRIDVLINNAGISMRALFLKCDIEVLKRLMDVNFWGTVYCTRFALPYLLESNGTLVGISSMAGHIGLPGRSGYSASKFAVRGFLDAIRVEYLRTKLNVLVVSPGFVASEIRESALNAEGKKQGKSPRNEGRMMSAGKCAELIFKGVKRRRKELVMSFVEGKLAVFLNKWIPRFVDRVNYSMLSKEPGSPL